MPASFPEATGPSGGHEVKKAPICITFVNANQRFWGYEPGWVPEAPGALDGIPTKMVSILITFWKENERFWGSGPGRLPEAPGTSDALRPKRDSFHHNCYRKLKVLGLGARRAPGSSRSIWMP